jgi:hypothetical protein
VRGGGEEAGKHDFFLLTKFSYKAGCPTRGKTTRRGITSSLKMKYIIPVSAGE